MSARAVSWEGSRLDFVSLDATSLGSLASAFPFPESHRNDNKYHLLVLFLEPGNVVFETGLTKVTLTAWPMRSCYYLHLMDEEAQAQNE